MTVYFPNPVPPFPGWERRLYHLSRPVTEEDIREFLGNQDLYIRETSSGPVIIIHKYGLLEIHCIVGVSEMEIWFDHEKESYSSEYLDALIETRF